jgi:hypothetical protein
MKYAPNSSSAHTNSWLATLLAALAALASPECSAVGRPRMELGKVPSDMFIWRSNYVYETSLRFLFTARKVTFTGTLPDHNIEGTAPEAVTYSGSLPYETLFLEGNKTQGKALRTYKHCEMRRNVGDVLFHFHATWWQRHWPGKYPGEDNIYKVDKKLSSGDTIVARLNRSIPSQEAAAYFDLIEYIPALRNTAFLLEWDTPTGVATGNLRVSVAKQEGASWKATDEKPPEILREIINRESSMLYGAILDGKTNRQPGECWLLDGSHLAGLIYPTLRSDFIGRVVVRAATHRMANPPTDRFANGVAIQPYNCSTVQFLAQAEVGSHIVTSTLSFDSQTVDGGSKKVKIDFTNKGVIGDIYIDTDRFMVRHAYLKVDDAPYDGKMPKFGALSVNANLHGSVGLQMQYDCTPIYIKPGTP